VCQVPAEKFSASCIRYSRLAACEFLRAAPKYRPSVARPSIAFMHPRTRGIRAMSLSYLENRHNKFDSHWTPERVELLKQLWADGYSASQIAKKFPHTGFTRCSIIGKAHRLNLVPRAPRKSVRITNGVPKPPMPPPPPPPPAPQAPQAPRMRELALFKLKPHQCHWPLGEWFEPPRLFCAADANRGEVYCPFHTRIARSARDA